MRFRWTLPDPNPLLISSVVQSSGTIPLLAQCLINRGLTDPVEIASFVEPRLRSLLDPFLIPDMAKAAERLWQARERGDSVTIFGDYDVDGVTASAILLEVLGELGWKVQCYLPHRFDEGYGLSMEAAENCLKAFPATLLLAVDCGSSTPVPLAWLKEQGVDAIVLDHHQISIPAPVVTALVNPRVSLDENGDLRVPGPNFLDLCSAGLAFKLAHAVLKLGRERNLPGAAQFDLKRLLDLVALGTVADVVSLTGENRILVSAGLSVLGRRERLGLRELMQVAKCGDIPDVHQVGFQIAPRLNAAGRLETARDALDLLLTRDVKKATKLATGLDAQNRERQRIERAISQEALISAQGRFNRDTDYVVVEARAEWHVGVVGIVASRLCHHFHRPTLIFGGDGQNLRGSGRSIPGFDLAAGLQECHDLLLKHGGHAMAAGVTVAPENLERFRLRLNEVARKRLSQNDLQPVLKLDGEVALRDMDLAALVQLERLKPTGQGNPSVQFFASGLHHERPLQRMGTEKQHVKLWVTDGHCPQECVWWGAGQEPLPVGRFDLAFSPQINHYNGRRQVQLKVLDWRPSEEQA